MLGRFLSLVCCLLVTSAVQAEVVIGVEWLGLDTDTSIEPDISSLGVLDLQVGYRFRSSSDLS